MGSMGLRVIWEELVTLAETDYPDHLDLLVELEREAHLE
jgi:hypothetical protein